MKEMGVDEQWRKTYPTVSPNKDEAPSQQAVGSYFKKGKHVQNVSYLSSPYLKYSYFGLPSLKNLWN